MALPTMHAITLPLSPTYNAQHPAKGQTLTIASLPIPSVHAASPLILIQIHAVCLTPYELTWPQTYDLPRPRVPCQDISGVVISSPATTTSRFKPGDRVFALMPLSNQGGLAEYVVCEEKFLAKIPDEVGFVEAATLPRAGLTAWQVLREAMPVTTREDRKGEVKVLVTGATGAVGRMTVQILKYVLTTRGGRGEGRIIAVGGTGSEMLKGLGTDRALNYREVKTWEEEVLRTEGKVDIVIDIVGGTTLEKCLPLVRDGGRLLTVGSPIPIWKDVKGWQEAKKRGVETWFYMVKESGEQLAEIADLVEKGIVKPSVSLVVNGLSEEGVRSAWTKAEKGGMAGSVVVKVRD